MACNDVICGDWRFNFQVDFLSSSGAVLTTLTSSAIPTGACYDGAIATGSPALMRCRSVLATISGSATKMRLRWTVSVQRAQDGLWLNAWEVKNWVVTM